MSYTVKDGKIIPDPPGQYEYGERYVECAKCLIKRPADQLEVWHTKSLTDNPREEITVVCKDYEWCRSNQK